MSDRSPAVVSAYPPAPPTPFPYVARTSTPDIASTSEVEGLKKLRRRKGVHSAHTPSRAAEDKEPLGLPKHKRIHSAIEKRQFVSLTAVNETPYSSKVWGETSYSVDYAEKKPIPLPKVRPASATRMHNPQPSKMFLQWRIPTRIHSHDRAVEPSPEVLKDIKEDFYKDYSSNVRPGDSKYEVPVTNVAKIPFPGSLELSGKQIALATKYEVTNSSTKQLQDHKLIDKVLKPQSHAAFKDWIQNATDKEKEVLGKMLREASVDDRIIISEVFQHDLIQQIQTWLKTADNEELEIAKTILRELAARSKQYKASQKHSKHCKAHSRTWRQPRQKPITNKQLDLEIHGQGVSVHRPHSAISCSHCSESDVDSVYKCLQKVKQKGLKPPPAPWNHRINPPLKAKLLNRGSMFNLPQKPRGQHFALHPEWPTA